MFLKLRTHIVTLALATTLSAPLWAPAPVLAQSFPDFTQVVSNTENAVVNIRTWAPVRQGRHPRQFGFDSEAEDLFRFFFGPDFFPNPRSTEPESGGKSREVPSGVGSGFIIAKDGYVITNEHVIRDASRVLVTLNNGQSHEAKVIGTDKRTDLALLKIEAKDLQVLPIGNSDSLKKGQWVLAIGSPYDLESTVTAGIVSAINRDTGDYLPFVQTDVAINPGNSGGPLIDLNGKVVGVNSQIYTRSGGSMGISFSIPINDAMQVIEQLKSGGTVSRGRLGVHIDEVKKDVADALGLDNAKGVLITRVEPGSPAEKAGLQSGDVVLRFADKVVEKWSDFPRMVGQTRPGTKASIEVWRHGKKERLSVVLGAQEVADVADNNVASDKDRLGLSVRALEDKEAKFGVVVTAVEGAAAQAGIRRGDIILIVDKQEVESPKHYQRIVKRLKAGKAVAVLLMRNQQAQWVTLKVEK